MRRLPLLGLGLLLAALPAVWGLAGNATFSQSVPVRLPPQAQIAAGSAPAVGAVVLKPDQPRPADGATTPRSSSGTRPEDLLGPSSRPSECGRGDVESGDDSGRRSRGGRHSSFSTSSASGTSGPSSAVRARSFSNSGPGTNSGTSAGSNS